MPSRVELEEGFITSGPSSPAVIMFLLPCSYVSVFVCVTITIHRVAMGRSTCMICICGIYRPFSLV